MTSPDLPGGAENQLSSVPFKLPGFSITDHLEIVAIDTETTGLNPNRDEIIEIAAVKYTRERGKEVFNSFVRPRGEVPHYIEYLTHITPLDLKDAPDIGKVLRELKTFVGTAVIVGQNTRFDLDFLNAKLIEQNELPLMNQWWDTSELGRIYLPFTSNHRLGTLCEEFGISLEQAHRAIHDASATADLFFKLIEHIIASHGVTVNARLLDLSRQAQTESSLPSLLELIVDFQRKFSLVAAKPHQASAPRHNIIEHKCLQPKLFSQPEIYSQNGILQKNFGQFEFRSGQLDMAECTEQAFAENHYLLVEAGTGVGKSFAYLIPALQFSHRSNKKVVVSTNTKNLQEQLFHKDLPVLKNILQIPYKAVLVKGRDNYICARKWEEMLLEQSKGLTAYEASALLNLQIWKLQTNTGDVTENSSFDRNRFGLIWRRLGSDRYSCAGKKCPHFNQCYVMKLRRNVEDANLVIINHSLLLADLMSDHASLGEYEHLIVDEAHNIMQTAARQLGIELSYAELMNQLNQLSKVYNKKNTAFLGQIGKALLKSVLSEAVKDHIKFLCSSLEDLIEQHRKTVLHLFEYVAGECEQRGSYGKFRIKTEVDLSGVVVELTNIVTFWKDLLKQLHALSNVFSGLNAQQVPAYDMLLERLQGMEMRAVETENDLLSLLNPDLDNFAYWLENTQKPDKNLPNSVLCYAPIEVNQRLREIVYDNLPCVIFTSATLALRDSFKFFKHQSGLDLVTDKLVVERVVDSPFDYPSQSRLIVAGFLPEPGDEKYFLPQALDIVEMVMEGAPVGTLTLFTSYKDLDAAYSRLNDKLYQKNRPLFAQGKWSSRSALLDEFKKHNNAVLLGTSSFWEGIDVQGESLSLLIIFKLPFQVPTEPVVEAYIEKLQKENLNSFMHYSLPNALLRLRQGFGRLIRSKTDNGVVLILDPRVTTKYYGHFFQEVLPATSVIINDPLKLQSSVIEFLKHKHSYFNQG
jgi:ATP-dependent DNA helicase DinG